MVLLEQLDSQLSPISFYSQEFNHMYGNIFSKSEFYFSPFFLPHKRFTSTFCSWDYMNLPALQENDKEKRMENKIKSQMVQQRWVGNNTAAFHSARSKGHPFNHEATSSRQMKT